MKKKKILIIEDETELADMIRIRLEKSGYEVALACDGEEGLKKAEEETPDIVLLDIILPKVDGWTVCKKLKRDPKTKNIPILITSAGEKTALAEKSAAAGADGYILKPFETKDLLEKIAALLV